MFLTDTGENVQKWTRVLSTRRWVILVARTRRKKEKKKACPLLNVFACGQVLSPRLYWLNGSLRNISVLENGSLSKFVHFENFVTSNLITWKIGHFKNSKSIKLKNFEKWVAWKNRSLGKFRMFRSFRYFEVDHFKRKLFWKMGHLRNWSFRK